MRNLSWAVRAIAFLAIAGGIGLFIGWMVSRQNGAPVTLPAPAPEPVAVAQLDPQPEPLPTVPPPHRPKLEPVASPPPQPVADDTSTNWEGGLETILLSDDDDNTKADKILALIPTAPADGQVELAQHLVNMVQDDHYTGAGDLLTNSTTPSAVSTVLMNDLLNRNNTLKLPTLLDIAREDDHPLKDQAREMLELLLQEDHGSNWDDWSSSINTYLTQNQ